MSKTISAITRKSGWRPKTAKAVSDEDLPAGKKQKQIVTQLLAQRPLALVLMITKHI